jgi:uncharacterized protein (DUF488 family)
MGKKPLYSIGHGSRKIEDFLMLLQTYEIKYLVDVRSQPYSRFHPQFRQKELKEYLEAGNIEYVFMGDSLGGRPKDKSCYNEAGKVDYGILAAKDFFTAGIERLKTACEKNVGLAIMCSERNPGECHRSKLVGKALAARGIVLQHIDESGRLKEQGVVMGELNKQYSVVDLFMNT